MSTRQNITDKTKKWLTIAGLGIVCVALVIAIFSQFKTQRPVDYVIAPSTAVIDNKVNPGIDTGDKAEEKEVVIQANEPVAAPTDDTAAKTDQPVQNLQPEVTKPAAPTESQKTDKTQKPNGEKVDNVKAVDHDSVKNRIPRRPVSHRVVRKKTARFISPASVGLRIMVEAAKVR